MRGTGEYSGAGVVVGAKAEGADGRDVGRIHNAQVVRNEPHRESRGRGGVAPAAATMERARWQLASVEDSVRAESSGGGLIT